MSDETLTLGAPLPAHWDDEAGRVAYEAWALYHHRSSTWDEWDELEAEDQTAWCLAAAAVLALVPSNPR